MKKTIITIGKRVSTFISIKVLKFRTKELCYAATLILCLSNGAKAQVCFTPSSGSPFTVGTNPQSVCSADFNGDGKADLATANWGTNNVSILLGTGTGTFGTQTTFAVGNIPFSVISADFNGDGKLDLAVANFGSNNVSILPGTGTGTFGTQTTFAVGANPRSVTSADFNGDGFQDLATANHDSNNVSILPGTGTGTFGTQTTFAVGTNPESVTSADFNGDGFKDLATANLGSNNVSILPGTGTGTFGTQTTFAVGTNPSSVTNADFNGDGKADLATANEGSNNVSILLGTGTGSFGTQTTFAAGTNPESVISADFNGDGKADLATANRGSNNVSVLLGTGTGTFGTQTTFAVGTNPESVTNADFNGDGKADLATANTSSNNVSVLLNTPLIISVNSATICAGATATLTASGAGSYMWSPNNDNTNTAVVSPTVTTNYTVTGTDVNNCINTATSTVTVNPLPTVSITPTNTTTCAGHTATLTASGANTYLWNTGATTANTIVTPAVTTTYTVTGTDVNSCTNTAVSTVTMLSVVTPAICMVTTDSVTNYQYNVVYWNKTGYSHVDSFLVYRYDAVSTHYLHIGSVSNAVLSEFTDTAFSIGGPNGGNPQYGAWKYKLAIRDTCGNIGALSPYHSSIFVQESGSNFSWTQYIDSGYASLPTGYSFLRDDNNTGSWTVLANLGNTATSTTDPNYASYPNANWRIDALGFNCNPTLRLAGNNSTDAAKIKAHSNINNNRLTSGISKLANTNAVNIYPNPANTIINLKLGIINENTSLAITDMLGNTVKQFIIYNSTSIISVSDLAEGVYNISISSKEGVVNKRVVIVK